MLLWISFAVLAVAVVWAVTRPLLANNPGSSDNSDTETELAVYKDQLAEIEAEREQGLLASAEAHSARTEVARRLIRRADDKDRQSGQGPANGSRVRRLALYAAAALPVIGIALYLVVGSPGLPGRPYTARLNAPIEEATTGDLVAKVEAHLRTNPEDGKGWDVIAPVYMRIGNFQQAADAYQRAIRLLGESPKRLSGFARATIFVQNGIVTEPARRAFDKLRKIDPDAVGPQVWLAIAKEQDGDLAGAASQYRNLLAGAGSKAPWSSILELRLKGITERLGGDPVAGAPAAGAKEGPDPAPSASTTIDQGTFAAMSPEARKQYIEQMVDGLATRLKSDGNDLEGWMRLIRSYVVLGRKDEATSALADARSTFAGDEKSLAQLQALADSLGLGS